MKNSVSRKKQNRKNKKDFIRLEKAMQEALQWITCPLGDVNKKIERFRRLTSFSSGINIQIREYFERKFEETSEIELEKYHKEDKEGFSCYDYDMMIINN